MPQFDAHAYLTDTPFSHTMASREAVLETMRRHGTTSIALISGLAARCDFVTGNRRLHGVLDPAQGVFGYLTLNTGYPTESQEEQRRYLTRREFLAGALFGQEGQPVVLEDAREILNAHRRFTKPMAISVSNAQAVHEARRIAAEFPAMKFVLLTMGGEDWHVAVIAAKQHLNIYLEISGSLDSDKISNAAETVTPRKLLYGSGLPYGDPQLTLGLLENATTVTNPDRRRILSDNALGLFNAQANTSQYAAE